MSFRLWVGLWVFFALIVIVAFDLSALVRYITRFTEESFAVLISIIFIFESFKKLAGIWKSHPIAESEEQNCHCQTSELPLLPECIPCAESRPVEHLYEGELHHSFESHHCAIWLHQVRTLSRLHFPDRCKLSD